MSSRLSSPVESMKPHYDAVVVGSGYGGGIAASRLSRAGQKVCLLERGREIRPGEYPDTEVEGLAELQIHAPDAHIGKDTGMFDFHVQEDINVLVGCGLGGTSLINANVALKAVDGVWHDERWPAELRGAEDELGEYYRRAETMLRPTPYPDDFPTLPKLEAHRKSAEGLGMADVFYKPPINVTFEDGVNHAGVEQKRCINCGDCVSGCNHWAKNTTLMNYLPDARNHGAEIFTECSVKHLERGDDGKWIVHFEVVGQGRKKFDAPELFVTADVVVVSAGTLGSTEILLRSKKKGLDLSDHVGRHFSGNGDVLGFAYDTDTPINGIGFGTHTDGSVDPVGPCISSIIDHRDTERWQDGFVIEEGSIPGTIGPAMPAAFALASAETGQNTETGFFPWLREKGRAAESFVRGPYHGAIHNTQTYLVMSHDGSEGVAVLQDNDRMKLDWPNVGKEPIFQTVNDTLKRATEPLGGTYVEDPIWVDALNDSLISVHPLGGCCMADDAEEGVTNHKGQVFAGTTGTDVHDGLYVTDGSIVPLSLGVNPLLTISALSERVLDHMAKDRGWSLDVDTPSKPPEAPAATAEGLGIQFTETMKGFFSTEETSDFQAAYDQGKSAGSAMAFTLTVQGNDLDALIESKEHPAEMFGTVSCRALSEDALTVTDGTFNLFVDNPDEVETKNMVYRMAMRSEEGRSYYFHGYKIVHTASVLQAWPQTTTLYVTVYEGTDESGPVAGKGILHIQPLDFAKQMTTMKVLGAHGVKERAAGLARFGKYFAGVLFDAYGGVLAPETYFDPDAEPRKKRPLRVGPPEVHHFETSDGVTLRLTRYRGGDKGPVLMVHGAGVSSRIFSTDLVETNLLEYLYAHGYDLWLFDFRISIALPCSEDQCTGDQVARIDHPEAVDYVRRHTGAESIQAVVHCYGSNTFFMALLAGMEGVHSVVCSQVATNLICPIDVKLKSGLHLPSVLDLFGVDSLTAYVDEHSDWKSKLFDELLRLYPMRKGQHNESPVSHRITFMYGELYQLEQLDQRTFDHLHELFGVSNITTFEHLALMVREQQVMDHEGKDVYMPHLDRLALPMCFLHGEKNKTYLPKSTQATCDLLRQANGDDLYTRHVIPGYGHIDCIFGKNAVEDVYPHVLDHLENTLSPKARKPKA